MYLTEHWSHSSQSFPSMSVLCNWESLCTKIVVVKLQSSGLRSKHGKISCIKITHITKIIWIVLSWIFNKYMPWHYYGRHFCTQLWLIKVHLFYQWAESHCSYYFGMRYNSIHSRNILSLSTGRPDSTEILMPFALNIFRRKSSI